VVRIKTISVVVGAVLAMMLAFGACSSSGDEKKADDTTTSAAPSTDAQPSTTTPIFTGEGSEEACATWRGMSQRFGSINPTTLPPAERQAAYEEVVAGISELQAIAPAEIAADVAVVKQTIDQILPILAANDYDINAIGAEGQAILASQEFGAATFNINAYVGQVCVESTTTTAG